MPPSANEAAFQYYPALRRVKEYVAQHLDAALTLEHAARVAGMSRTYFSSFFHQKTGVRFRDWRGAVRVERAEQMMRSCDDSITDIAFAVGYQDLRTFERDFKKHRSATPRSYKKSIRPC